MVESAVKSPEYLARLEKAKRTYEARQAREENPDGKFDNGGRWYPSAAERKGCCYGLREPSRNWPYSLMVHCRTLRHVSRLCEVSEKDLKVFMKESAAECALKEREELKREPETEIGGMCASMMALATQLRSHVPRMGET